MLKTALKMHRTILIRLKNGGGFYVDGSHNSFTEGSGYIFTPFSTATIFSTKMNGFFAAGIGLCNGRRVRVHCPIGDEDDFIVIVRVQIRSGWLSDAKSHKPTRGLPTRAVLIGGVRVEPILWGGSADYLRVISCPRLPVVS